MRAVILSTGDELTTGRTLDTNANYIADQLIGIGIDVVGMLVVGDYPERIAWAWRQALSQADVVLCTGGLGPTADDLTTETVAAVAGVALRMEAGRRRPHPPDVRRHGADDAGEQSQAGALPGGCDDHPERPRHRPGLPPHGRRPSTARCHGIVMPGVPREMKQMLADEVLPWLRAARGGVDEYRSHTFQTFGISESALDELVVGAVDPAEARLAFRAAFPQISLRVTVQGPPGEVDRRLDAAAAALRERIGAYCYGEGNTTMEAEVGKLLAAANATIGVAESCTGGLIGHRLTDVPGSSAYVRGGVVAYSNAVKQSVLGVQRDDARAAWRGELRNRRGDGARRAAPARRDHRPRHHRHRRPRRRHARQAGRHGVHRARRSERHPQPPLPALGHARLGEAADLADRARLGAPRPARRGSDRIGHPPAMTRGVRVSAVGIGAASVALTRGNRFSGAEAPRSTCARFSPSRSRRTSARGWSAVKRELARHRRGALGARRRPARHGEVPRHVAEATMAALHEALAAAAARHPGADRRVRGLGAFPMRGGRASVWAGVDCPSLTAVATASDAAAARLGFASEARAFRAHVTLGTGHRDARASALTGALTARSGRSDFGACTFDALVAFRSDLRPDGALYTKLWSIPFGG